MAREVRNFPGCLPAKQISAIDGEELARRGDGWELSKNLRIIPSRTGAAISRAICSTTIPCVQRSERERGGERERRPRRERLVRKKNLLSPPLNETLPRPIVN